MRQLIDSPTANSKERETQLRALTKLLEYADGRPSDQPVAPKQKDKSVIVLPDKQSESEWMKAHGQEEVVEQRPN